MERQLTEVGGSQGRANAAAIRSLIATKFAPTSKLSQMERLKVSEAKTGLHLLDTLKNEYTKVQEQGLTATGGGLKRLGGIKGTIAGLSQASKEAAAYNNVKKAFLSRLSRASGEKGVLTDKDLERIEHALPNYYDSPDVAQEQWRLIEEIMKAAIDAKVSSGEITETLPPIDELQFSQD
jgi:hypothetical protein